MKKAVRFIVVAIRRNTFLIGVVLGVAVFGFISFKATAGSQMGADEPKGRVNQRSLDAGKIETDETGILEVPEWQLDGLNRSAGPQLEAPTGVGFAGEVEPNGTFATASPIGSAAAVVRAPLFPNGDIDFYSFTATAGDRIYAATMTSSSAGSSTDSQITILSTDGTTVLEFDDDNGSFAALSSSNAGVTIPSNGTYFIKVNDFTAGTTSERPYELYFRRQTAAPTAEVESNDTPATANPLPASGHVSGARNPAAATEQDWYSFTANAGDTVMLSLDVDPEDDLVVWNGRLGLALFGDAGNQILVVDDAGTGDVTPNPNRPSEAMFMTFKTAGTYFAFVDSASAAVGGPTATYNLSVTVFPATNEGINCTTYTSTNVPQTIGPGTGLVSSTITVPGNPRIADLDVDIVLNHALMQDIDAHLRSPAGNNNGLFSDIGAAATGGQTQMDLVFDDEAGIPPAFTVLKGTQLKPENNSTAGTASTSGAYRLSAYDGENAGGVWTLDLYDDTAGANGGALTAWSLRICEQQPLTGSTVFSTDFESGAAGFTHSGTQDEWELGTPATAPTTTANPVADFTNCHSGTQCWKTDLDNTYNASANFNLVSPTFNLNSFTGPFTVEWAMRHQVETANFDHAWVGVQLPGNPGTLAKIWEWQDPTYISASAGTGNPQVNIGGSAGWGLYRGQIPAAYNTQFVELVFHLDSDTTVNFGGMAIDDVRILGSSTADLAITKTDGVTTAVPGGSVTYTITASNAGPSPVTGGTVADTFPAILTATWTCVGAGGGTCTAAGAGNINDTVNLPAGGSVTYTASATISASATGTLSNTATVSGGATTDPVPGNNSATDSDTLTPQADLSITKTDGVTSVTAGGSTTYTITASNSGPSNATGATVADTFPAVLTATWTCVGAGGGTCTAAGAGNINDTINLPAGGSVTYTASSTISGAASGSLANTATVTTPGGVTDPVPGNNSATDTDTVIQPGVNLTGTNGNDVLIVTATGPNSGTYSLNGAPSVAFSGISDFDFNGLIGDDTFTINNPAGGLFAPSGGIDFSGGGQPGDIMNLIGGGGPGFNETYFVGTTTPPIGGGPGNNGDGLVRFTGPNPVDIRFTGLAPIVDTVVAATLTVNATDAANTISVTNGGVAPRLRVAVDAFEPIDFDNKANVIVNGGDGVALGDLADNIAVNYSNVPAALVAVGINANEGNDTVTVVARSGSYGLTLNGNENEDTLNAGATVAGPGSIVLNGDDGNDALIGGGDDDQFDGGAGNDTFIGNGGTDNVGGGVGVSILDQILAPATAAGDTVTISVNGSGFLLVTINGVTTTYRNFVAGPIDTAGIEEIIVNAAAGNDTVTVLSRSGSYNIILNGNDDNDTLDAGATLAGAGAIFYNGGLGNDTLIGGGDDDQFDGGAGDDTIVGNGGSDNAGGGAGADGPLGDRILVPGTAAADTATVSVNGAGKLVATVNGLTTTYSNFIGGPIATAGIESVSIAADAGSDTINVVPIANIAINVDGGSPVLPVQPGDVLGVDFTGTTGLVFTPGVPGSGVITFTNRAPVSYVSIETPPITQPTTTTVTSSANPSVFGQNVTFTAAVTSVPPGGTPTGTVQFFDNAVPLGTVPVVAGVASLTTSSLGVGNHPVTATFTSNWAAFSNSAGALIGSPQVVNPANTATGVQTLINAPNYGLTLTATATITAVAPGAGVPQGT
ncbi:MAG: Ig-like domain repeat protein, partial [Pyrinomonadaceae bacterium]